MANCRRLRLEPFAIQFAKYFSFDTLFTQPLTSRGCSCISCTNKANGIHVLGWCTSWLVHFLIGALLGWCT